MRFPPALILLLLVLGAGTKTGHAIDVTFATPEKPRGGFDHMSWTVQVQALTSSSACYYWAAQVFFLGGGSANDPNVAYAGIQPYGIPISGSNRKLALFSAFGRDTAAVTTAQCENGADGGSGVSCRLPYAWAVARTYRLDIALSGTTASRETWTGTVTDVTTSRKTEIARWSVPRSWGLLDSTVIAFAEYFEPLADCNTQPYARVQAGAPVLYAGGRSYRTTYSSGQPNSGCYANERFTPNASGVLFEGGLTNKL